MPGVLVVDDERLLAEETAIGLDLAGIAAVTAGSAAEAMALLRAHAELRVLVSDIRMPQIDGVALARQALAERGAGQLAVIFMTGHATDAVTADMAGVVGQVRKPFAIEELTLLVRAALDAPAAGDGLAVPRPTDLKA
jgi:DNA-binding NtrC family response regulator